MKCHWGVNVSMYLILRNKCLQNFKEVKMENYDSKHMMDKYDFNLYKGFFMEKMTQIHQILNFFFPFFKSPDFYDKFQQVAKNIEES